MFAQVEGGEVIKIVPTHKGITIGDTQHDKNIYRLWSKEELKNIGLLPYRENTVDNRFYQRGSLSYEVGSDEVVGTYSKTDKDVATLKEKMIEQVKNRASKLLAPTDWMVLRATEGGTAMADAVKTYRTAIRKESNDKETEIKALSDLDAVKLYEATPYIETRKNDAGEEVESEVLIGLTDHYFAKDPLADDTSFISLVKKG